MNRIIRIFLMIAVATALSVPATAQVGRVVGIVTDEEGNPLKGVQIKIEGLNVRRNYKVKTDKNGKFLHAGVSLQSTYRVIAEFEGYRSDYVEGVKPGFNEDGEPIEFVLKKGSAGKMAFEMTEADRQRMIREAEEARKQQEAMELVRVQFDEGRTQYEAGNYEAAVTAFQAAAEKDPDQIAVWANLGQTYAKMKKYEDAIKSYEKAIDLDPSDAALQQNLGNIHAEQGDTETAEQYYNKAAEIAAVDDPKAAATTYYNMGVTHINAGKSEDAAKALKKALEFDASHAEAHYQLGLTLLGLNQMEDAVKHLERYVSLDPAGKHAQTAKELLQMLKQ